MKETHLQTSLVMIDYLNACCLFIQNISNISLYQFSGKGNVYQSFLQVHQHSLVQMHRHRAVNIMIYETGRDDDTSQTNQHMSSHLKIANIAAFFQHLWLLFKQIHH